MEEFIKELLEKFLPPTIAIGTVLFLLRNWILERLKSKLKSIYDRELENHKAEITKNITALSHQNATDLQKIKLDLDRELEKVKHQHGIDQLRTSLFFNHQKDALNEILLKIISINKTWWREGCVEDFGLVSGAPPERSALTDLYATHRLFLDEECCLAVEIAMGIYQESLPFHNDETPNAAVDPLRSYMNITYVTPKIAALFQKKLGLASDSRSIRQLALFDAIRILNQHHFSDINLPTKGALQHHINSDPAEAVRKAEQNYELLLNKCIEFQKHLQDNATFFHEAEHRLTRLISILKSNQPDCAV